MNFATHVFDCDGVLLDSNRAKSEAFYRAALPYGDDAARQLVAFHRTAGSISRRERIEHFFTDILKREPDEGEVDAVVEAVDAGVREGVFNAPKMPGVEQYLETVKGRKVVVSGVHKRELVSILEAQGLSEYFADVWGGPRRKSENLKRAINAGVIELPAVYYGDTEDDCRAAGAAGLEFVYVFGGAETDGWADPSVRAVRDFTDLLPTPSKVRVGRDGYADINGDRIYIGRRLAGAVVKV